MKRRHHYVPRFYLRAFAAEPSDPRRIHIYNLARSRAIKDAALRDQCHAHKLYGEDDRIEDALATIEGTAARLIATIRATRRCPLQRSEEHFVLLYFLAYQMARTESAIAKVVAQLRSMERAAFDGKDPPAGWGDPEDGAMLMSMRTAPVVAQSLSDLAMVLIETNDGAFITSDSPTFAYNRYCEGIKDLGVTGIQNEGFQLFFPLAPDLTLLLYDAMVYKVGSRGAHRVAASAKDVDTLNRLQLVSARSNVYFSDWCAFSKGWHPLSLNSVTLESLPV